MSSNPEVADPQLAERRRQVDRFVRPIQSFMSLQTSGGVLLLGAAVLAMLWANSPWSHHYHDILEAHLAVDLGFWSLDRSVHFWVNDAAMVLFFFVVGLEIKRETVIGELSDPRRVIVPIVAAIGGMVVPALVFIAIVGGGEGAGGWGIPLATDIAFAIGVLTVVGNRVPFGLRVMLLALAIVDDIGGIIVIALFYTSDLSLNALAVLVAVFGVIYACRHFGIWYLPVYFALGAIAWAATVETGIHPTITGVLLGLLAPWKAWYNQEAFVAAAERQMSDFMAGDYSEHHGYAHEQKAYALRRLRRLTERAIAPLDRLEHDLQPLVAFLIVPVFAFANAGVSIGGSTLGDAFTSPVALGVFFGLFVGKPLGILLGTWVVVRAGASLPTGVKWSGVLGIGILGGIGFTVSLLITELSYSQAALLTDAKLGIIVASLLAGIVGFVILKRVYPEAPIGKP